MKTIIFDGLFVYKDLEKYFDNKTSLEIIYEKAKNQKFDRFILLQNGNIKNIPDGIKNVVIDKFNPSYILSKIYDESKNTENIVVLNAGCPFYDVDFISQMIKRHEKYIADYTYSIGYPEGLIPVIIRREIIKELIELVNDVDEIKKDYFFYALSKNINSFDIETFLSEIDLRVYRISIGCNDTGEDLFTRTLFKNISNDYTIDKIIKYLNDNLDKLYTTIYLATFELTNITSTNCIYLPDKKEKEKYMDFELIKKTIDELKAENQDVNIILGGIGEPLLHDKIMDIINYVIEKKLNIIIETYGINIDNLTFEKIDNYKKNIIFVFKIDAYEKETYKIIHQNGDFDLVNKNIEKIKNKGFKVYKQITRMIENEIEIEKFIRNKETDDLIIRKYSTFCDTIPDKKVVDLSPFERIPCFHLRREIYIKSDGQIPACYYSRNMDNICDLNKDNLKTCIKIIEKLYIKNSKNQYMDYCKNCNDYYLFNF